MAGNNGQAEITELITQAAMEQMDVLAQKIESSLKLFVAFNNEASKLDKLIAGSRTIGEMATNLNNMAQAATKVKMSQEDLLSNTEKHTKVNRDYKESIDQLSKSESGVKLVNNEVLSSLVNLRQELKSVAAQQKELDKQLKDGEITNQEYASSYGNLINQAEHLKGNISQLIQLIKTEAKENIALKGSMDEMAQRLGKLKDMYRQLNAEERENPKIGGELLKSIHMQDAELKNFDATIGNYQRNIGNYKSGMEGFQGQMKNLAGTVTDLATAYLGFMGVQSIGSFLEGSVEEFMQADKASRQLETDLNNLGMSSAFDRFKKKGEDIQKAFEWIDNDDVNRALDQLITYGKLTEGQMDALLPVIVDFAAKTGKSVPDATEVMIKALEGSGKELKAFGVHVDASKSASENLGIIMTQLKPRVEGAAQAFSESMAGALASTKQEVNDLKEDIGNELQPVLKVALESIQGLFIGIKQIFGSTGGMLKSTVVSILGGPLASIVEGAVSAHDEMAEKERAMFAERATESEKEMTSLTMKANQLKEIYQKDKDNAEAKKAWGQSEIDITNKINAAKAAYGKALLADHAASTSATQQEVRYYKFLYDELVRINNERSKVIGFGDLESGTPKTGGAKKAVAETIQPLLYTNNTAVEQAAEQAARDRAAAISKARLDEEEKGYQKEVLYAKQAMNIEVELAGENEDQRAKAKEDGARKLLLVEITHQQKILEIMKDAGMDTVSAEQKLVDLKAKLMDEDAKNHKKAEEEKTKTTKEQQEKRKEIEQKMIELSSEMQNTISSFVNGRYDEEKNKIQDNIDAIEKKKAADIAANDASGLSAQEKAAQATLINTRAQTQREQLERRQRQIDQERARFERAMAIARIVQSTAVAIAADISTPWKIALDVALGAMAMSQVVSKPIPRFATGRSGGPATLAIVGDGGRAEVIESPTGQMTVTPDSPTLTFLPQDYKVHPSIDDAMESVVAAGMATVPIKGSSFSEEKMADRIAEAVAAEVEKITEAIHSRPEHHTTLDRDGLRETFRKNGSWLEYLRKNMS